MASATPHPSAPEVGFRFGSFEYDPARRELRKHGIRLRLQRQPLAILLALIEAGGAIVTREELRNRLWPSGTFVDFERGLNSAIKRLRDALSDSADQPRYIETVPGEGYRFIAAVKRVARPEPIELPPVASVQAEPPAAWRRRWVAWGAVAAVAAVLVAMVAETWPTRPRPAPAISFAKHDFVLVTQFANRTGEPLLDQVLAYAVERELDNSQHVSVVSPERVKDTLALMKKAPDTVVDRAVGREICLRDGGIKLLITGDVEKEGSRYLLNASLIDPASDVSLHSFSEEAEGQEAVTSAIHRLTLQIRQRLGEALSELKATEPLAPVSTPSLHALLLYSQADAAQRVVNNVEAEQLLREAIREDPQFASAYVMLGFALGNEGKLRDESAYYKRAFDLANTVPARERYFIEANYDDWVLHDAAKAAAAYETLLRLYPDHAWAVHHLAAIYRDRGNKSAALNLFLRVADLQPNSPYENYRAWRELTSAGDPRAEIYFERLRRLRDQGGLSSDPNVALALACLPASHALQNDDADTALRAARSLESELQEKFSGSANAVAECEGEIYLRLGRLADAQNWLRRALTDSPGKWTAIAAIDELRGDRGALAGDARHVIDMGIHGPMASELARRAGLPAREVRRAVVQASSAGEAHDPYVRATEAEADWAAGHKTAVPRLASAVADFTRGGYPGAAMLAESVADALIQDGKTDEAIAILEPLERKRAIFDNYPSLAPAADRLLLSELLRKAGRVQEAEKLEAGLLRRWKYADPDFPLLLQLKREMSAAALASTHSPTRPN